jgi:hypothetical protein
VLEITQKLGIFLWGTTRSKIMACTTTLPAVSFVDDCPTIKRGQIYKLYTTRATAIDVLDDVEDLAEWTGRIDQDAAVSLPAVACAIREWSGIGSLAEGEVTDIEIPLDLTYSFTGNQPLTFTVYDMTTENIAAAIAIRDAGTVQMKVWFQADDLIFGGNSGINGSMRANLVIPEGRTDPQRIILSFNTKNSLGSGVTTPHPVI